MQCLIVIDRPRTTSATAVGAPGTSAAIRVVTVSAARPRWPPIRGALVSGVVALSVELFKLFHAPVLDAFRLTLLGRLLLGRLFSLWDLFAYACALVAGALADRALR